MDRVLFICVHNSARSQMAEAYLKRLGADDFEVESAGFDPTEINPLVVEVMAEEGVDLAGKQTQKVFDLFKAGKIYHYVITVCSDAAATQCPIFPGVTHRLHLPFDDPAELQGDHGEKLRQVRVIRDHIKAMIHDFVAWTRSGGASPLEDRWSQKKAG